MCFHLLASMIPALSLNTDLDLFKQYDIVVDLMLSSSFQCEPISSVLFYSRPDKKDVWQHLQPFAQP